MQLRTIDVRTIGRMSYKKNFPIAHTRIMKLDITFYVIHGVHLTRVLTNDQMTLQNFLSSYHSFVFVNTGYHEREDLYLEFHRFVFVVCFIVVKKKIVTVYLSS